ncbi:MAG TPA: polysaccharide deacetylase family protein [Patescibacteria group bacterium]|nr:polysaccharide deacetylase family protein [Patescibacteria group bacterium]
MDIRKHYRERKYAYSVGAVVLSCLLAVCVIFLYGWHTHNPGTIQTFGPEDAPGLTSLTGVLKTDTRSITQPPVAPVIPLTKLPLPDITPDIMPFGPTGLYAPVVSKIKTQKRVVFMGVDDGAVRDPRAIDYIKQHHYPFTLFLSHVPAGDDYGYFKPLVSDANNTVEDHTITHPNLTLYSFAQQKREICGQAENIKQAFGNAPVLFRPPYGLYNASTQRAAAACGMKAVVLWSAKVNDGKIQYQDGEHIVPGDIMLMHFRPKIIEDLKAFTNEIESQHLTVAKLEDWLR